MYFERRLVTLESNATAISRLECFYAMNAFPLGVLVCLTGLASPVCFAASGVGVEKPATAITISAANGSGWSSSVTSPDSDLLPIFPAPKSGVNMFAQAIAAGHSSNKPFSALGVAVKVGVEGVGFDVATPLARKFNLRAGASFFSYQGSLTEDGIQINPDVRFRKAAASLDYYPFGGSFRVSPGFVFYNGNHATATALVPAGQTFDLNDTTYTSSVTDPVRGSAIFDFGKKQAPSFTIGWGNSTLR